MPKNQTCAADAWTGTCYINMIDPQPEDIHLKDIAVGLAREFRYGGRATETPWSVAKHLLFCDQLCVEDGMSLGTRRRVFVHDFSEYMLRDILKPLKDALPDYVTIERRWEAAMDKRFSIPEANGNNMVRYYDHLSLVSEKYALISAAAGDWLTKQSPRPIPKWLLNTPDSDIPFFFMQRAKELHFE